MKLIYILTTIIMYHSAYGSRANNATIIITAISDLSDQRLELLDNLKKEIIDFYEKRNKGNENYLEIRFKKKETGKIEHAIKLVIEDAKDRYYLIDKIKKIIDLDPRKIELENLQENLEANFKNLRIYENKHHKRSKSV